MCDPVFDRTVQLAIMGGSSLFMNGSAEEKFRAAVEILSADRSAYFLPVRSPEHQISKFVMFESRAFLSYSFYFFIIIFIIVSVEIKMLRQWPAAKLH